MRTSKGTELPLLNLRGAEYLEVKYRLVWFREERPFWRISTEFIRLEADEAIAKATITSEEGAVMATAHKREDKRGFPDFMEKAETGAIGRALALCGYGTQFCADELSEGDRIVDAPVAKPPRETKPSEKTPDSLPSFVIGFGKYKGMRMGDVEPYELQNYADYILKKAAEDGKPIRNGVKDFIDAATSYLDTKRPQTDTAYDHAKGAK